jgi:hypothetical protein
VPDQRKRGDHLGVKLMRSATKQSRYHCFVGKPPSPARLAGGRSRRSPETPCLLGGLSDKGCSKAGPPTRLEKATLDEVAKALGTRA